mgnify:CR=1 FL=1
MLSLRSNWPSVRNALVLMSGTSSGQLILLAASPVLTRLYTPEDFGVLALFAALAQILSIVASGRYEIAILLPDDDYDAFNLASLACVIAAGSSIILLVVLYVFNGAIATSMGVPEIGSWLYLLPVAVFFGAGFNIAQYLNLRHKTYSSVARATVSKYIVQTAMQLGFGFAGVGHAGLVVGATGANVLVSWPLLKSGLGQTKLLAVMSRIRMRVLAFEYKQYPLFSMPAGLLFGLNINMMNFALPVLFSPAVLGFYSLAMRALGSPLAVISHPIGQVFQREVAQELADTGKAKSSFIRTFMKLLATSFVVFGLSYFFIVDLFGFIFGEQWIVAGEYALIMIPLFTARFLVAPLSDLAQLIDARFALGFDALLLAATCVVIWVSYVNMLQVAEVLSLLSSVLACCYVAYLPILYYLALKGVVK